MVSKLHFRKRKIFLLIIDGLGDEPIPALGNRTPLEAAKTPNLDFLAEKGITGLILPYTENKKSPTSEETHFALFGYQPKIFNPGRGVLEVLGMGMKILPGDVCLRGNFATLDKEGRIIDRRAGRIEETEDLIKDIGGIEIEGLRPPHHPPAFGGPLVKFLIGKGVGHRIGIIMRPCQNTVKSLGQRVENLSPKISDSDPKVTGVRPLEIKPLDKSSEAKFTARILNQFLKKAESILKNHPLNKKRGKQGKLPANYILVRGAGTFKKIPSFYQKYKLKACCIAGGSLYKGIGKFLGMDLIESRKFTGLPNTDLRAKFLTAKKALLKYDFVFCHIKAVDNLAEDGNFRGKKEFIEKIDKNFYALVHGCKSLIVVTGDHSTCSLLKKHCSKPIPILIFGNQKDKIKEFSEKACKEGGLGRIKQLNLMAKILELAKD